MMQQAIPAADTDFLFREAIRLHGEGRLAEAASLYSRILEDDQTQFGCLHNLGILRLQQGRPGDAFDLLLTAVDQQPESFEARNSLGMSLVALGRTQEAVTRYQEALAINPDYAEAHYNLGNAFRELGQFAEAVTSYEEAIAKKPEYPEALNNLGNVLLRLERADDAVVRFEAALSIRPDFAEAYENMGKALTGLGRLADASQAFDDAVKHAPQRARFYHSLAGGKHFSAGDPQIADLESLGKNIDALSIEERINLHFALSKALADLGLYERSFAQLLSGNLLKRRRIFYDEHAELKMFERIRSVFTPQLMRAKRSVGDRSRVPIFILGMPRSGSTLVEQILASHKRVFGAGELSAIRLAVDGLAGPEGAERPFPEVIATLAPEQLNQIGKHYIAQLRNAAPTADRITDKMPANFRFIGFIHLVLPNARIVHTRRNPIDTCLSNFSLLFPDNHQPHTYDLGELGRYYRAYEKLMEHWRAVLPPDAMIEVQYEDVVADLETQARRIIAHCGLEWDDACLAFHTSSRPVWTASATQVRRPLYGRSIGRWHPYKDMLRPLLEGLETPVQRLA
jgi:tetratricopeptide (TPR) repeat protein